MTVQFYLLPLDQIGQARGPAYLKWRYRDGLDCHWSVKDFGDHPISIVASDIVIPLAHWTTKTIRNIATLLSNSGLIIFITQKRIWAK